MSVRRSLAWTYLAQGISFFVTFASTVVVARLVSPRDFGIFAMATALTTSINVLMQFGLAKYIMRETELSRDDLRTVFTLNLILTIIYVAAILIGGLASGQVFKSAEVGRFLFVFALFPVIAMFEFVPAALCAREARFRTISVLAVVRACVLAGSTIFFASEGSGYMSFAWAQVLSWAVTSICYNIVEWRPQVWKPRFAGIRSVLRFGTQMIGINGLSQLNARGSEMVLGSLLGLTTLGLYSRASSLPSQLYVNVYGTGSNVFFIRLSQDLRDIGSFHEIYVRFLRLIIGLVWPMMFGLAVLAQPVIHILYGDKWQAAATPLALLTIAAAITVAIGMSSEVFILRRETPRQVKIETVRAIVGFVLFTAAATVSLTLAAAAKIAEAVFAFVLYRRPMIRLVGAPVTDIHAVYREGLGLTAAAVMPALLLMVGTGWSPTTSMGSIIIAVVLGGLLWLLLLVATRHPLVLEAASVARIGPGGWRR